MSPALVLVLLVVAVAVAALSRRYDLPAPLVLVAAGLIASYVPGTGGLTLSPDLVLYGALPPLLFHAALESSSINLKANIRPIALLSIGLVLFTTAAVAAIAYLVLPTLGWPLAFALGAIVSPPDAVAATAIGRVLHLPRRVLTILSGESLLNDATALTVYRVAVAAAIGTTVSFLSGVGTFTLAVVVGVAVGVVLGLVARRVLGWLADAPAEIAVFLLVPFGAYPLAELLHGSGVLAVVSAGLLLGRAAPKLNYATRLQGDAVFGFIDFVLESIVFGLIGLQLRTVLGALAGHGAGTPTLLAVAVTLTVIVARIVWMWPASYRPRWLSRGVRRRDPGPSAAAVMVMSWAGMRGVVTLAAAFALPLARPDGSPLAGRDLVLLCSFVVVVATLLVQGLSLPTLIRRLHLSSNESATDTLAEAQAAQRASRAAIARLDELQADPAQRVPDAVATQLRDGSVGRANAAWERLGRRDEQRVETPSEAYRRLRREMLAAERSVYLAERDARRIDDEVLRTVQRDLDLEESAIER